MASTDLHPLNAVPAPVVAPAAAATWANSAPLALVCEAAYKRSVLPIFPLAQH